jgi:hypothetical protein
MAITAFPDSARALTDAAQRRDRLAAWDAAGRLAPWLADLRNRVDRWDFHTFLWTSAIRNRWFDIAELLAAVVAGRPDASLSTRRLHAQMLLERGFYEEALERLGILLKRDDLEDFDRGEALGHVGRIHKDRFIAARSAGNQQGARSFLRDAIQAYLSWYTPQHSHWHGVNALALLSQPDALAFDPEAPGKARQIAREILQTETAAGQWDSYKWATLAEARIALDDFPQVLDHVRNYLADPNVSSFQIGNLLRQLTQLWELDRRPSPWPELVTMIRAVVLEREGAVLQLSSADVGRAKDVTAASYQAVFGADRFDSYENYRRGLDRCACVARIGRSIETGTGTGFVLPGSVLGANLGSEFVLVTNAHVVSEAESVREQGALHPAEAVVTFAALEGVSPDQEFGLKRVLFWSGPTDLDVCVSELSQPVQPKTPYRIAPLLPTRGPSANVRVIGHPSGRGLSLSMNNLLDYQKPKLHYKTATEGGSSGSPVFDREWMLIGLHHAGGEQMPKLNGEPGTYEANEGIWISAICDAIPK